MASAEPIETTPRRGEAEVLKRILARRPDLSVEELQRRVEEKKRQLRPFLTDEGAAYLLSQELGVELFQEPAQRLGLPLSDLMPDLKDVSVAGRILVVHSPRSFTREDGSQGRTLRLVLADGTGLAHVVLWNSKADEFSAKGLAEGQTARLLHGYTKADPDGGVELHLGERSAIESLNGDRDAQLLPQAESLLTKIKSVGALGSHVWIEATVVSVEPASVFEKENGVGHVRRLILEDETGRIALVLWNEEIDELSPVEESWRIRVLCGVLKPGFADEAEIHLGRWGKAAITLKTAGAETPRARIADLERFEGNRRVETILVAMGELKEFTSVDGRPGRALSMLLADETGMARLTLWDKAVDNGLSLKEGDFVEARPSTVGRRFGDLELQIRSPGLLSKLPSRSGAKPLWLEQPVSLRDLAGRRGYVTVEGTVAAPPETRRVTTARGVETQVASFPLQDSSGTVRVSLWGALADKASALTMGRHVKLRHARVVKGLSGNPELSSSVFSSLENLDDGKA